MRFFLLLFSCILVCINAIAQNSPRQLKALRTNSNIKIDGILEEAGWQNASIATDFIEWRPNAGKPEDSGNKTIVYLLYDNTSVYVGGYCHERTKDSISRELIGRDKVGINDFVGVILDTYNDKINAVGFYVTPYGEQYDAKYSNSGDEDGSWSAVWDSEAKIHNDGWSFEMRIPYSALRFANRDNQTWGLNITRRRNKTGQQFMWDPVSPEINGFINQEGELIGIEKIEAPMRLSFSPYLSGYMNHYKPDGKGLTGSVNGGMDVKYGINDAFTLDMTLIPDFGQVRTDNQVLNLSPFEIRFTENRPFFTEGTELFNKGNLFYSRRIGSRPIHYSDVNNQRSNNETIVENPQESKLINATKLSGRLKSGLGIGFFNALTKPMYAVFEDDTHNRRKLQTNPLTNYNIIVLDQNLKNNSSVSLLNTNVLRSGHDRDANVTAALFNVNNKKNTYNWNGKFAYSQLNEGLSENINGYSHSLTFGKTGGTTVFSLTQELVDDKYDINDMGILFNNNYLDHYFWIAHRWNKPKDWYNRIQINYNASYSRRFKKSDFQGFNTNINGNAQFKNLWWGGFYLGYITAGNDFYESRIDGRVYKYGKSFGAELWGETNSSKKYYLSLSTYREFYSLMNGRRANYSIYHRYRFNDKFSLIQRWFFSPFKNNVGYYSDLVFSKRDRNTVENSIEAKYNFNNKSGLSFIARHYWSKVKNKEFFALNEDGTLTKIPDPTDITHQNYNDFYINAIYTLQFAPGSFINIVWKNDNNLGTAEVEHKYFKNLNSTLDSPHNNNLSVKIIYFLDYLDLKKKKRSKT